MDDRGKLKELYKKLYEMTQPVCASKCSLPQSCCSAEYCLYAISWAKRCWDEKLEQTEHPQLPLMGANGCVAPPHTRPMCTAHVCEMTLYKQGDSYWKKYWAVRQEIDQIEWRLFKDIA